MTREIDHALLKPRFKSLAIQWWHVFISWTGSAEGKAHLKHLEALMAVNAGIKVECDVNAIINSIALDIGTIKDASDTGSVAENIMTYTNLLLMVYSAFGDEIRWHEGGKRSEAQRREILRNICSHILFGKSWGANGRNEFGPPEDHMICGLPVEDQTGRKVCIMHGPSGIDSDLADLLSWQSRGGYQIRSAYDYWAPRCGDFDSL